MTIDTPLTIVRSRVWIPAIFLMIVGVLNLGVGVYLASSSARYQQMEDKELRRIATEALEAFPPETLAKLREKGFDRNTLAQSLRDGAPIGIGWGIVAAVSGLLSALGAWCMLRLRGYPLAIAGAVLASLPCISPMGCCLLGEGIGIWSLVVLINSEVRAAFSSAVFLDFSLPGRYLIPPVRLNDSQHSLPPDPSATSCP